MPCYHILVGYSDPKTDSRLVLHELDMSKNEVEVFVEQYQKGRVLFKGKWLDVQYIEEVEILETQHLHDSWANIAPLVSVEDITISSRGKKAKAVTRQFIKSEPSGFIRRHAKQSHKDVFIVHGRDHKPMKELKTMLYEFGLKPIVLHEQPSGSRTIVEKLEKHSDVGYAFVILTPDDIGSSFDAPFTDPRARQNVILEFGYFIGKLGRDRVCCLYKGDVELPSDMHGIVYIPFGESVNEIRDKIIRELAEADYEIKT